MAKLDSSAELSAVLNTLVDGLLMIDANGTITLCNPAAERIFGYKQADIKGKNVSVLMPEPDRSAHNGYIENYQRTAKPKIIGIGREVKGRKADGTIFPMYLSVGESMGAEQTQFVGIVRDLTEENNRKDAFEHLQQEHFHLSRVAAMDQFGSAIAHELNQPLSAIMNYLEAGSVIMQRGEELDRTQIETIMERASGQAGRAADILARLRKFIETGNVEKKSVDIADVVHSAAALVTPSFKQYKIDFQFSIAPDLPRVMASSVQVQQVLVNLIRNGCEAMADTAEKTLKITAEEHGTSSVKVGVLDTGSGITPDALEKLYQPFNSTKGGGLGVGLSICRSIIAAHDGKLWSESAPQTGTHFYFSLPAA